MQVYPICKITWTYAIFLAMNTLISYSKSLQFLDTYSINLLGNPPSRWIVAALVASILFVFLSVLKSVTVSRLQKFADRTQTQIDDIIVSVLSKTNRFFISIAALFVGSWVLQFEPHVQLPRKVMMVVLFWQIGIWASTLLNGMLQRWLEKNAQSSSQSTAVLAFRFVGRFVIWALILLLMLDNLGVKVVSLMAGLGVGGIAIALAVQSILGDLLSSVSIVLDKPFELGDFIIVGDSMGTVEHVGLKTTRLRSLSGEQLIISNSDLLSSRIRNYKRMSERRMVFTLGVTYQTSQENLAKIPQILKNLIESQPNTRFDRAHLKNFGAYAIEFEYVYWMTVPDMNISLDIQQAISLQLVREFAEQGIDFAYPTQTLFIEK